MYNPAISSTHWPCPLPTPTNESGPGVEARELPHEQPRLVAAGSLKGSCLSLLDHTHLVPSRYEPAERERERERGEREREREREREQLWLLHWSSYLLRWTLRR